MKKGVILAVLFIIVLLASSCVSSKPKEGVWISLDSKDAELIGDFVYEGYEGRYCIGLWQNPDYVAKWSFEIVEEGEYQVYVRVACGDGQHGSIIGVKIDDQDFEFEMPNTGAWEYYLNLELTKINLTAGTHTVEIQGKELSKNYFGNIQSVMFSKPE